MELFFIVVVVIGSGYEIWCNKNVCYVDFRGFGKILRIVVIDNFMCLFFFVIFGLLCFFFYNIKEDEIFFIVLVFGFFFVFR